VSLHPMDKAERDDELFPPGLVDEHNEPLDMRKSMTWNQKIDEISPVELMEVQIVNSTVPFMFISSFTPLLKVLFPSLPLSSSLPLPLFLSSTLPLSHSSTLPSSLFHSPTLPLAFTRTHSHLLASLSCTRTHSTHTHTTPPLLALTRTLLTQVWLQAAAKSHHKRSFIVNVTAVEGMFSYNKKNGGHPHTSTLFLSFFLFFFLSPFNLLCFIYLYYFVLFCFILYYFALFCFISFYFAIFCFILFLFLFFVLFFFVLFSIFYFVLFCFIYLIVNNIWQKQHLT
jgi:hypothetical protein